LVPSGRTDYHPDGWSKTRLFERPPTSWGRKLAGKCGHFGCTTTWKE
jgi:hypothetical protein